MIGEMISNQSSVINSSGPEQHRLRPIQREGETASPVPQFVLMR